VGIVTLHMQPGPLALGCPPTVEVPYYHGPIYDLVGGGVEVAATFHSLSLPGRLAIDNPLDEALFRREMAGKPAILLASGDRAGRGQAEHGAGSGGPRGIVRCFSRRIRKWAISSASTSRSTATSVITCRFAASIPCATPCGITGSRTRRAFVSSRTPCTT
jgi:hypothetical protein